MKAYKKLKLLLLLLIPMGLTAANPAAGCKASFTWKQTGSNVISFTNTSSNVATSSGISLWSFGDASGGWTKNPVHAYAAPGRYQVCLSYTNADSSCSSYFCDTITVEPVTPICKTSFSWKQVVDITNTIKFENTSVTTSNHLDIRWDFGDGGFDRSRNPMHTYASPGQYKVCLYITDSVTNCYSYACNMVTVYGTPVKCNAAFSWKKDSNNTVYFNDQSVGTTFKTRYAWRLGDGTPDFSRNPIHTYKPGRYVVCLSIIDSTTNCYSMTCDTLVINPINNSCKAGFSAKIDKDIVYFTNHSAGVTAATKWQWNFGDGSVDSSKAPIHKYKPGRYKVCLTATGDNCYSQVCDTITVSIPDNKCRPFYIWNIDTVNHDNIVHFMSMSQGITNWTKYHWDFGDGSTADGVKDPYHQYAKPGTYNACLTITDDSVKCTNTYCSIITSSMEIACKADYMWKADKNIIYFSNTSKNTTAVTKYNWKFGDGSATDFSKDPVHKYASPGKYTVCLEITDSTTNCYNYFCSTVIVEGTPPSCKAGFTWTIDNNNTVNFKNQTIGITSSTKWYWNFGDGSFDYSQTPAHNYKPGTYKVCLTATDSTTNCYSQVCNTITIPTPAVCTARFTWYSDTLYNTTTTSNTYTIFFTNQSMGLTATTKSHWDFGDGTTSSSHHGSHKYAKPGKYKVCLTISDSSTNCYSSACNTIEVREPEKCNARFYWKSDDKNLVYFNAQTVGTSPRAKFYWNFGDGTSGFLSSKPSHKFGKPGTYKICLTITDSVMNCYSNYCESITFKDTTGVCTAHFSWKKDANKAYFFNQSKGTTATTHYYWDFGDNSSISHELNPVYSYKKPGRYTVCLSIGDSTTGCYSYFCDTITAGGIANECKADFTWKQKDLDMFQFTNTSSASTAKIWWHWTFGDGTSSLERNPLHVYKSSGTYDVCLTMIDSTNNCHSRYCDTITAGGIVNECKADFTWKQTGVNTFQFKDQSSGTNAITWWYWTFGDGNYSNEPNPSHMYKKPGKYTVCLNIYDTLKNCKSQLCKTIIADSIVTGCKANFTWKLNGLNMLQFRNISSGTTASTRWYWTFDDGGYSKESDPSYVYKTPGKYRVCLKITDSLTNCYSYYCDTVTTGGISDNCKANFTTKPSDFNLLQFSNLSTGTTSATRYRWNFGDGSYGSEVNPLHGYKNAGIYYVCLTITDSLTNCKSYFCDTVRVSGIVTNCKASFSWNTYVKTYISFKSISTGTTPQTLYAWDFGDGESGTGETPLHNYKNFGTYNVCLKITDPTTGCNSYVCQTINVTCYAMFRIYKDPSNANNYNLVNDAVGSGTLNYTWNWNDNTPNDHIAFPSHTYYTKAAFRRVCLTIVDGAGCTSTYCDSVATFTFPVTINVIPANSGIKESNSLSKLIVYPNPAQSSATISYTLVQTGNVKINIFNLLGEQIKELENSVQSFGTHEIGWNTHDVPEGIYLISVTTNDNKVTTQRISVIK